jgi:hypothetical protein
MSTRVPVQAAATLNQSSLHYHYQKEEKLPKYKTYVSPSSKMYLSSILIGENADISMIFLKGREPVGAVSISEYFWRALIPEIRRGG